MKAPRVVPVLFAGFVLAGCGDTLTAPSDLTVPSAAQGNGNGNGNGSGSSGGTTPGSLTVCSSTTTTQLSYDRLVWIPAFPTSAYPPYGTTIPGSSWVAPLLEAGTLSAPEGTYYFRTSFTLPAGATSISLAGQLHADNHATVYLNGTRIFRHLWAVDYPNFQDPSDPFSARSGFVSGANQVTFDLLNAGPGPSAAALDFCFTVNYQVPAAGGGTDGSGGCPAAPAVANRLLGEWGVRHDGERGKWLLALVARHMSQGARFDGYEKCDPRYGRAVEAFLRALLSEYRDHDDDDDRDDDDRDDDDDDNDDRDKDKDRRDR